MTLLLVTSQLLAWTSQEIRVKKGIVAVGTCKINVPKELKYVRYFRPDNGPFSIDYSVSYEKTEGQQKLKHLFSIYESNGVCGSSIQKCEFDEFVQTTGPVAHPHSVADFPTYAVYSCSREQDEFFVKIRFPSKSEGDAKNLKIDETGENRIREIQVMVAQGR